MESKNKKEKIIIDFKNKLSILKCPFCSCDLSINEFSLKCKNNHTFNISKKGTTILYKTSKLKEDKLYNKRLFLARRQFINGNFYNALYTVIGKIIDDNNIKTVLDMGSGEGTHDIKIIDTLMNKDVQFFGIDLSKDAIDLSNDFIDKKFIGIVGDLNYLPIKDNTVDLVLNILSPSNEKEMARILKKDGLIIKVTPKKEYLSELRCATNMKEYENEEVIDKNIHEKYEIVEKKEMINTFNIDAEMSHNLINMTPLMKNGKTIPYINQITIALNIYILRIKR